MNDVVIDQSAKKKVSLTPLDGATYQAASVPGHTTRRRRDRRDRADTGQ